MLAGNVVRHPPLRAPFPFEFSHLFFSLVDVRLSMIRPFR